MTYITTVFRELDCLLCALCGGAEDTTISMTAARAEVRGERWGCALCWWLHQTLRQRHCARTLAGEPMSTWAMASAAVQLAMMFALLFYGVPLAIHAAGAAWASMAT